MSIETMFRAALLASAPLVAQVGSRVSINAAPQGASLPYVVFTSSHATEYGLSGSLLADVCTIEAQCWGESAAATAAVGDAVRDAAALAGMPMTGRSTGHDPELGLDADILQFVAIA
jgi:hypothetical protein